MPPAHLLEPFLAAADEAAAERDDVDAEVARELMAEAAAMLHDSLALDDLDPHDLEVVVAGLGHRCRATFESYRPVRGLRAPADPRTVR